MSRARQSFPITDVEIFKRQLLTIAARYEYSFYLDGNNMSNGEWECLVGMGAHELLTGIPGQSFDQLKAWYSEKKDWMFGFMSYELKNEVEQLHSENIDGIHFPELGFIVPEIVCTIQNGDVQIYSLTQSPEAIFSTISSVEVQAPEPVSIPGVQPRMTDREYLEAVAAVRNHIIEGDLYEMNLCREFYNDDCSISPVKLFHSLNLLSRAPFSCYMQWQDKYLISASPERFLKKKGNTLYSQPIKGTRPRGKTPFEDTQMRQDLAHSEKDRAENVMIVDLVRNDLARNCKTGSVVVDELFGIYSFPTVHQMISTVQGELRNDAHPVDAIRDAFPMGSMTGAPKVMAMELIEKYEQTKRGLYSGAVGYFTPEGDFDFNVVIRSILYNATSKYLSFLVGGAIVFDSVPEQEMEECAVKAAALRKALGLH